MTATKAYRFEHRSRFQASRERLWAFHMREDALNTLSPGLLGFEEVSSGDGVADGSVVELRVGHWPVRQRWVALHHGVEEGAAFTDTALDGPFPYWVHHHRFEEAGNDSSELTDVVWFVPPRWIPSAIAPWLCRAGLRLLFEWRHRVTRRHVENHGHRGRNKCVLTRLAALGGNP